MSGVLWPAYGPAAAPSGSLLSSARPPGRRGGGDVPASRVHPEDRLQVGRWIQLSGIGCSRHDYDERPCRPWREGLRRSDSDVPSRRGNRSVGVQAERRYCPASSCRPCLISRLGSGQAAYPSLAATRTRSPAGPPRSISRTGILAVCRKTA